MVDPQVLGALTEGTSVFEFIWELGYEIKFPHSPEELIIISSPTLFTNWFNRGQIKWRIDVLLKIGAQIDHPQIFLRSLNNFEVVASCNLDSFDQDLKEVSKPNRLPKAQFPSFKKHAFESHSGDCCRTQFIGSVIMFTRITITLYEISNQARQYFVKEKTFIEKQDDYENLLLNEKFTDLTLISSDEKELHVLKSIFINSSPALEAMLENDIVEKSRNKVTFKNIRHKVLLELFRFIYSGKVKEINEILCELLLAADQFFIDDLKLLCEETMIINLSKDNAIEYFQLADRIKSKNAGIIYEFIVKNVKHLVDTPEFKSLSRDFILKVMMDIAR